MHDGSKQSAAELRLKQVTRYVSLAILAIMALCLLTFMYIGTVKQSEAVAHQNTQIQAQAALDTATCKVHPDEQICVLAHEILTNPAQALAVPGDTAVTAAGREVKSFTLNQQGSLVVMYVDGTTGTIGRMTGSSPATSSGTEALGTQP